MKRSTALALIVVAALCGRSAHAQDAFRALRELMEMPGILAVEEAVRPRPRAHLPAWTKPEIDGRGNLVVTFGTGTEHLLFVAHLDEIGYVITKINEDGTLSVRRRAGFGEKLYEARPVMIYTARGPISGIITPRHVSSLFQDGDESVQMKDIRVYLGTETKKDTEDLGIQVGDSLTVPKRFTSSAGNAPAGRFSEDRTGCTAMLLALMSLDPAKVKKKVTFIWTVEERVGLNGARALAEGTKADYVFAVDTFAATDPTREDTHWAKASLGQGFVIRALDTSGVPPLPVVNRVLDIAQRHKIPVSWPSRPLSPSEVIDRNDLDALSEIIHRLVLEF